MTSPQILAATLVAAFLYVVSPGPAFLALFTLAASRGRAAGAKFICGHLVGDVTWGALAVTAIVGANRIGPTLFELLGFGCGLYLVYLGGRAVMTRREAGHEDQHSVGDEEADEGCGEHLGRVRGVKRADIGRDDRREDRG
jgi:threonine/homoserine/homoserine lactone efflux protein